MNIMIATIKSWNTRMAKEFIENHPEYNIKLIGCKDELTVEAVENFQPQYIFFPHWSWKISRAIYEKYECIAFHMADLPFGRGGSPLQNLIVKKIYNTKISAFRVTGELDAGPVYLKENICLYGSAEEIFIRSSKIIFHRMIPKILEGGIQPQPQSGNVVAFKRRGREDGDISQINDLETLFDYIRMLDAEGYPKAFLETEHFMFEFSRASLKTGRIIADVVIKPQNGEESDDE